jgi:hypothetical protein
MDTDFKLLIDMFLKILKNSLFYNCHAVLRSEIMSFFDDCYFPLQPILQEISKIYRKIVSDHFMMVLKGQHNLKSNNS